MDKDIRDLIKNTLGGFIGFFLCFLNSNFNNYLSILFCCFGLTAMIVAIIRMIINLNKY